MPRTLVLSLYWSNAHTSIIVLACLDSYCSRIHSPSLIPNIPLRLMRMGVCFVWKSYPFQSNIWPWSKLLGIFLHSLLKGIRQQVKQTSIFTTEVTKGFLRRASEVGSAELYMEPFSLYRCIEVPRDLCVLLRNSALHADRQSPPGFSVKNRNPRLRKIHFM